MHSIIGNIFKQRTIGQTWGRFALAGSQIAIVFSSFTMLMVAINAYATISTWLLQYGIHLRFWVFMTILAVPIIIAYFIAWKFLVATFYRSSVDQFMTQNKELTDRLTKLDNIEQILGDTLPEINDRLEALEKK